MKRRRHWIIGLAFAALALAKGGAMLLDRAPEKARFRVNPLGGDERARAAGRKLFLRECAACHGGSAEGIGKAPPLRTPAVWNAPDGAIEWALRNGSLGSGMPSFSQIPPAQRWQIVTYLKSLGREH